MYDYGFFGDDRKNSPAARSAAAPAATPAPTAVLPIPSKGISIWMAPVDYVGINYPWVANTKIFQWVEDFHYRMGRRAGL